MWVNWCTIGTWIILCNWDMLPLSYWHLLTINNHLLISTGHGFQPMLTPPSHHDPGFQPLLDFCHHTSQLWLLNMVMPCNPITVLCIMTSDLPLSLTRWTSVWASAALFAPASSSTASTARALPAQRYPIQLSRGLACGSKQVYVLIPHTSFVTWCEMVEQSYQTQ